MKAFALQYVPIGGAQPRKYTLFTVEGTTQPVSWTGETDLVPSVGDLLLQINTKSSGTIKNFSPLITMFMQTAFESFQQYSYMQSMGFHNFINFDTLHVGDKFVINKAGSYIEVTYKQTGNSGFVNFEYKTATGAAAYTNVTVPCRYQSNYGQLVLGMFPWLNKLDGEITNWSIKQPQMVFRSATLNFGMSSYNPVSDALARTFWAGTEEVDLDEPYPEIDDSQPSGPSEGVGIPASDPVDFPSLPSFSATDTGFITLFNPTLAQVKALADYMWNGLFDVNNLKKIVADPMDCILGFNMLPVAIPNLGPADVCIGNLVSSVAMNVASSQWVEVDCGQLDLGLPYGSYLDFSPYTKYSIYLPYIGTCDLSADDVAGKVLSLKYHVDVLSCSCVAYLKCGDSVLYQWTGACGYSIPVTQNDFSRMIMSIVSMAAGAIGGAVTAGGGLASVAGFVRGGAESAAKNVMGLKPDVHRSGSVGSSAGLMGGQTPYLILEVPKACKPKKQYHYLGYPSFTTVKLGEVSGRQDFDSVILDGIPCTEEERDMIAAACEGGIYL